MTPRPSTTLLARWLLAAVFIYMGVNKVLHPESFLKQVDEYHFFTNYHLLNAVSAALPWFEVFCGIVLVTGLAIRGTALVLIAMLVPFTLLVIHRALDLASAKQIAFCAVKFDCGCGGGEIFICRKILENTLLLLLALWLLLSPAKESQTKSASAPLTG
jgi:uncharacterized membrane protein YphA (DoxX/SURF4 family)